MSDEVEIPDEAVEAACKASWDFRSTPLGVPWDEVTERPDGEAVRAGYSGHMRAALEAALEAALPLLHASGGPAVDRQVIERVLRDLAAEWRQSADEDERYLNRAHASEIHDVMASIRINREHADALVAALTEQPKD